MLGCLETPTAFLEAVPNAWTVTRGCLQLGGAYNSGSIRMLGCLETPTAFLEAVPNAWTVTRVPTTRGLYGCWGALNRLEDVPTERPSGSTVNI